jgi:hypothetical protein
MGLNCTVGHLWLLIKSSTRQSPAPAQYYAIATCNPTATNCCCCCCSLRCFAGAPPFNADTPQEIFERILDCNVEFLLDEDGQHVVSQECRDLISSLLQVREVHSRDL